MWLVFGLGATIFCALNLLWTFQKKDPKYFRFISMTLTSFTLLSFYYDAAKRVISEDWSGLMDILPTTSKALIFLTLLSVFLNGLSLFISKASER